MSDVLQQVESGVMTLTLNRLDKKNSFTAAMYAELAEALRGAAEDDAVRVVLRRARRPTLLAFQVYEGGPPEVTLGKQWIEADEPDA